MALYSECMRSCAQIVLDTADIVRDRDFSSTNADLSTELRVAGVQDLLNSSRPERLRRVANERRSSRTILVPRLTAVCVSSLFWSAGLSMQHVAEGNLDLC
jgi:hypothetical protein